MIIFFRWVNQPPTSLRSLKNGLRATSEGFPWGFVGMHGAKKRSQDEGRLKEVKARVLSRQQPEVL